MPFSFASLRHSPVAVASLLLGILLLVGSPVAAQFGKNKIQYEDFDWQIYHSPHFDVYFYSDEEHLLQEVVSLAESAYDHLSRRFDYQIEDRTPLIFYKTHAEFEQNNIIQGFIPEGIGAFATDVRFRMVLPVDLPDKELYQLILHELTHIFQYHILFGGKVSGGLTTRPPTWLVEGMASYYAEDESTSDKMFLRDAVVNDLVPPISQAQGGGFFAYRFGHAVYDYMEEQWGPEGVLDFLYEYRSSIGSQVDRALQRAFRIEGEDFDADFRRWLRNRYLAELVETGEPSYFGRRFFVQRGTQGQYISPAVSPSGDLVAALGTPEGDLDVVLFDTQNRRPLRNLTKGLTNDYRYLSAQFLTSNRRHGRDLTFSPDGNTIAVFGRYEQGRSLFLVDVLKGGVHRAINLPVQQAFAPTYSPDGRTIAFAGTLDGNFDIFAVDVETEQLSNLTSDERFDGGPSYSPDGRYLYYTSVVGEYEKLFRLDVANPIDPQVVLSGDWNDKDPWVTKDGNRIFFTSDRNGYDNIYSYDLTTKEIAQHTNAVTGCFMPVVLERADESEALVYVGYWKGQFDLYRGSLEQVNEEPIAAPGGEVTFDPNAVFEPDIQVAISEGNKDEYGGFKLFLEDADGGIGVTSDQLLVSQAYLSFSDYLGDRRLFMLFDSVSSFSNFNFVYTDLRNRLQWGAQLYDTRTFYVSFDETGLGTRQTRDRQQFSLTGLRGFLSYPFDLHHRVEASLGYNRREYSFLTGFNFNPETGNVEPQFFDFKDDFPYVGLAFVGDTATFQRFGPYAGRRWRIASDYAPDLDASGTLTSSLSVDVRQYIPISKRTLIAARVFGYASEGNLPNIHAFGGIDDFRGVDFRTLSGDRAFYANLEVRFPLVDALYLPWMRFQGIRGRVFLDVGGAWRDYLGQEFDFWDDEQDRLKDGVSAYGWGFSVNFIGLQLHWDFARKWDFDSSFGGTETTFWIGSRF